MGVGVEKPPELRATVTSVVEMAKERGILTVCCGSAAESGPGSRPISLAGDPIRTDTGPRTSTIAGPSGDCCPQMVPVSPASRAAPANSVVRGISLLKTRQPHRRL